MASVDLSEIERLYATGLTIRELASLFDTSDESIRREMIRAGIPRRPRGAPAGKHLPSGGLIRDRDGYVLQRFPEHPCADAAGYVRRGRLAMEEALGRVLEPQEVVGHIRAKDDDRVENLALYESSSHLKHDQLRGNARARGDIGNPKRRFRRKRTPEQMLYEISVLRAQLGRDIRRSDLGPPWPSWRSLTRAFGHWRTSVALSEARHPVSQAGTAKPSGVEQRDLRRTSHQHRHH